MRFLSDGEKSNRQNHELLQSICLTSEKHLQTLTFDY